MSKKTGLIIVAVLLIAAAVTSMVYVFTSTGKIEKTNTGNPEDSVEYIQKNGDNYSWHADETNAAGQGDQAPVREVGEIITGGGYMYVYGYYYAGTSTGTLSTTSLFGWVLQDEDIGWGVAVIDRTQTSYSEVYSILDGDPVTYANNLYYYCNSCTSVPALPETVSVSTNWKRSAQTVQ